MKVLGIETSCDETAAAVVDSDGTIHANLLLSQLEEHRAFGGVVPEIAARTHLEHLHRLIAAALEDADTPVDKLDGVAATCGPGLIGGVMVGMMTGKAIAAARGLPFIGVNHLEGHALTPRLTDGLAFPYLLLLVSGGHTQILAAEDVGRYRLWGTTIDDAAGECFDKAARLMGLPYPGGPQIEKAAQRYREAGGTTAEAEARFPLPRPLKGRPGCDFSFSGLKTAVRTHVDKLPAGPLIMDDVGMLCCALEQAVCDTMAERCAVAMRGFMETYGAQTKTPALVVSGGVAANRAIRARLSGLAADHGMSFSAPPHALCSDNAAMIAWAGIERLQRGMTDGFDISARPRWPLDPEQERA